MQLHDGGGCSLAPAVLWRPQAVLWRQHGARAHPHTHVHMRTGLTHTPNRTAPPTPFLSLLASRSSLQIIADLPHMNYTSATTPPIDHALPPHRRLWKTFAPALLSPHSAHVFSSFFFFLRNQSTSRRFSSVNALCDARKASIQIRMTNAPACRRLAQTHWKPR